VAGRVVGLLCALLGSVVPGAAAAVAAGSPLLLRSAPTAGRALPIASFLAMRDAQRAARGPVLGAELVGEAVEAGALSLRLRGGKKGTPSQGKRATGSKSHSTFKCNLSYPRKSRPDGTKMKRYTILKKPERSGRHKHLRLVQRRFKNGFRMARPYSGPGSHGTKVSSETKNAKSTESLSDA